MTRDEALLESRRGSVGGARARVIMRAVALVMRETEEENR